MRFDLLIFIFIILHQASSCSQYRPFPSIHLLGFIQYVSWPCLNSLCSYFLRITFPSFCSGPAGIFPLWLSDMFFLKSATSFLKTFLCFRLVQMSEIKQKHDFMEMLLIFWVKHVCRLIYQTSVCRWENLKEACSHQSSQ